MSEICLDCYNEYCGAHRTKRDVKLKMGRCEDCGQYKPLIVMFRCRSVKERFTRWRDDLEYFLRKLRRAVKHGWVAFWMQFRSFPVRRGGLWPPSSRRFCQRTSGHRPPLRKREREDRIPLRRQGQSSNPIKIGFRVPNVSVLDISEKFR